MKYTLKIGGETFEVEVSDPGARPVVATIDGERFEVWPEAVAETISPAPALATVSRTSAPAPVSALAGGAAVSAPIPGVIVSLAVQAGDVVTAGQELCALEAMKMKNVIRATRAGTVAAVRVAVGQQVQHHQPLLEFTD